MKENIIPIMFASVVFFVAVFLLCNQSVSVDIKHRDSQPVKQSGATSKNLAGHHDCSGDDSPLGRRCGGVPRYYAHEVGVESEAHRRAQMRADLDRTSAIMAVQRKLGDAAFEKTIHDAGLKEIVRIRDDRSYAWR